MAQIGIKQAENTLHTGLTLTQALSLSHKHTHTHAQTQQIQSQWAQVEENLSKAMARERREHMSVCLDVSTSMSVSLFGAWQRDTQVLFWSIKQS